MGGELVQVLQMYVMHIAMIVLDYFNRSLLKQLNTLAQ